MIKPLIYLNYTVLNVFFYTVKHRVQAYLRETADSALIFQSLETMTFRPFSYFLNNMLILLLPNFVICKIRLYSLTPQEGT